MNEKMQLKHPQGKKSISMSKEKYNLLKPAVLKYLHSAKAEATFSGITRAIEKDFKTKGQTFQGSLP